MSASGADTSSTALDVCVLTLFPEMFPGPLGHSLPGKALAEGLWRLRTSDIRAHAGDKHRSVDDTPYGGGAGMVLRPDIVGRSIDEAKSRLPDATLVHFTPRGLPLTQRLLAERFSAPRQQLILLCGRFEGIDERIAAHYDPLEISLGDFVLFGGEIAAMAMIEAMLRHVPGALGNHETLTDESFAIGPNSALLLEYPHYTKPPSWQGHSVPEVLLSGHHERIRTWRLQEAERTTRERRPDLWQHYCNEQKP